MIEFKSAIMLSDRWGGWNPLRVSLFSGGLIVEERFALPVIADS